MDIFKFLIRFNSNCYYTFYYFSSRIKLIISNSSLAIYVKELFKVIIKSRYTVLRKMIKVPFNNFEILYSIIFFHDKTVFFILPKAASYVRGNLNHPNNRILTKVKLSLSFNILRLM